MQAFLTFLKFWVCVVCWACAACHAATTAPPNENSSGASFAGWLDESGTATLATVQTLENWTPFKDWKGWGFGPEPVWLRVQVPAATAENAPPWVLIVRPAFLDRLTFYDPATGAERRSGDFFSATEDALSSVLFTFEVPALPLERQVYIKLQSQNSRVVHLSLRPWGQAQSFARSVEWSLGVVLVLSAVFSAWTFTLWYQTRERVMGIFALKQILISLWAFSAMGFARITFGDGLPEGTLSMLTNVLAGSGLISTILWFYAALLAEYNARPWMLTILRAAALMSVFVGLLCFVGQDQLSLQIINTSGPVLLFWIVLTLWSSEHQGDPPPISKVTMLVYVLVYAVLNSLPAMTHVGWIEASPILLIGNISMLMMNGLVMLVILSVRQRRFAAKYQSVHTQLQLQQEQARLDQQYLNEQRQLLAMLAHEMKTPLANLRIWMEAGSKGRPVMERAIHDMDRVIERCVHAGQLSDQSLQPRNEWLDAAELTRSLVAASRQADRVRLELQTDVCELFADAQMLSIVLSNVLENAYKYSAPESPIKVRLEACMGPQAQHGWIWQVENSVGAAGLPDPDKLFDKYYRGPYAQRQSGSGLGLFLVKSLMGLMGGQVVYKPHDDRVQFEAWLPVQGSETGFMN